MPRTGAGLLTASLSPARPRTPGPASWPHLPGPGHDSTGTTLPFTSTAAPAPDSASAPPRWTTPPGLMATSFSTRSSAPRGSRPRCCQLALSFIHREGGWPGGSERRSCIPSRVAGPPRLARPGPDIHSGSRWRASSPYQSGQRIEVPVASGRHEVMMRINWGTSQLIDFDVCPGESVELACTTGSSQVGAGYIDLSRV